VELPRSLLPHFAQPEVHMSVESAAKLLGFPGEKELRSFAGKQLKQTEEEPLGSHVGALSFKRLVALSSAKTPAARKLLEEFLAEKDMVNLPATPVVAAGALPRWPSCAPEELGMDRAPFERLHQYFQWRTRMRHFAGIACGIVRNGQVVYYQEAGYANVESKVKMTGDTLVRLFSMTKCLVAAAFMTFLEDPAACMDLDDPVHKYIPAFSPAQMSVLPKRGQKENQPLERPITLRQLLTHTSGIGYGATLDDPWPPQKGSYYKIYEELCEKTRDGSIKNLEEWCNMIAKVPLKGQPGHFWDYSYSLDVLGRVLEVVAGKPLDAVLEERICGPLKMRDTSFAVPKDQAHRIGPWYKSVEIDGKPNLAHQLEVVDSGGEQSGWVGGNVSKVLSGGGTVEVPLVMKGGMVSTFNDYLRFLMMIRNFGELDGVRVLRRETVQLMITNHVPASCNGKKTVFVFDKPGVGYSCLGQIQAAHPKQDKGTCSGEYGWGGLAGPAWTIDPRSDLIVLSMTQTAFVLDHEEYLRYAARRAIHQGIFGSVAAPAKATSYPPEIFDVVRPKAAQEVGAKEDQASKDTEFEEEYRIAKTTRSKTAKERAILPGARLDRHPSDEVDSAVPLAEASQESEATPASKRRRYSAGTVPIASDPASSPLGSTKASSSQATAASSPPSAGRAQASQVAKAPSPGKATFPAVSRPVEIDPSKPEELLFSRVAVRSSTAAGNGSVSKVLVAEKARITAIAGDALEVVAEGSWSTHNVKVGDVSLIEESQFGVPTVKSTDPKEFPLPTSSRGSP